MSAVGCQLSPLLPPPAPSWLQLVLASFTEGEGDEGAGSIGLDRPKSELPHTAYLSTLAHEAMVGDRMVTITMMMTMTPMMTMMTLVLRPAGAGAAGDGAGHTPRVGGALHGGRAGRHAQQPRHAISQPSRGPCIEEHRSASTHTRALRLPRHTCMEGSSTIRL
jgi:hypothetical protein